MKKKYDHIWRVYFLWQEMIRNCRRPSRPAYKYYGGKGISFQENWTDFESFLKDVGIPDNQKVRSIERLDSSDHYRLGNFYWTYYEKSKNTKRKYLEVTIDNELIKFKVNNNIVWAQMFDGTLDLDTLRGLVTLLEGEAEHD